MGLVTPLGLGVAENWRALAAGETGIREAGHRDGPPWLRWVGRSPSLDLDAELPSSLLSQARFLNRGGALGVAAALQAVRQSGALTWPDPQRRALTLATGDYTLVACEFLHPAIRAARQDGDRPLAAPALNRAALERVNPFFLLESLPNNPYAVLAAAFDLQGGGTTLASQSPSGAQALALAARAIRAGRAELALVVGCGSWVNEVPLLELEALGLLSRACSGAESYRPLDRGRDGFLAGEGGAALVLETASAARRRGAAVLAEIEGAGDATAVAPRLGVAPRVTERSMALALSEAERSPADLGFVSPHGSGTRRGDRSELDAVAAVLGGAPVPVCALKPATGHMGAGSDVAEVVLGVAACTHDVVPPTRTFRAAENRHAHLSIAARPQPLARRRFLSVSYGLGGQASAVVVAVPAGVAPVG